MLFSYLRYRQTKTSSGNIDIVQLRLGSPRRDTVFDPSSPSFRSRPIFGELLGQIEQLGLSNESTVLLGYSAKCFLTLVKNCGDNRVRLPFHNETTIFTLYVDRVGRTYASLFRGLVLCNFFQFTVLALSFL